VILKYAFSFLFVLMLSLIGRAEETVALFDEARVLQALDTYKLKWTELGRNSRDSMPLGNGDLAANVWVEESGDICFYLAKSDAWSERIPSAEGLLKLGRIRVSLQPNPFTQGQFSQTLDLRQASITLVGEGDSTRVRIWIDANANQLRVEVDSARPVSVVAKLEPLRTPEEQTKKDATLNSKLLSDVVVAGQKDQVVWYYRTTEESARQLEVLATFNKEHQDGLTFGGVLSGPGFVNENDLVLRARAAKSHKLHVQALTKQTSTAEEWIAAVQSLAKETASHGNDAWEKHVAWWEQFWTRSWVFITDGPGAHEVTQAYLSQRFMAAASSRGSYPAKFNGSLFTVDMIRKEKDRFFPVNGDFRRWGGQYWFQNTRLIYWPMLAAGDFDLMQPFFRMYSDILKANAAKVKENYGFEGSCFAETSMPYGGISKITHEAPGHLTKHYWLGNLEYLFMAVEYYRYTRDETFAREILIPSARQILAFYTHYYGRDEKGMLLLDPLNSGETWVKVKNPAPDIAALKVILGGLLELPDSLTTPAEREEWRALSQILPPLPIGEKEGERVILAAEDLKGESKRNFENPELYPVFPFGLYGVGKPDLDVAKSTFKHRLHKGPLGGGWNQDPVKQALLGDAEGAQKAMISMSGRKDKDCRFPALWMDHQDYVPNFCHGGMLESTLQSMLLQTDGKRLLLLPAWPGNWSVQFRLHAPDQTIVTGSAANGKLTALHVTPEARASSVVEIAVK
jgi:alpha-L-fucosidase 2